MVVVVGAFEKVKLEFNSSGSEMAGVVVLVVGVVVVVVGAAVASVGAIISVGAVVSEVVAFALGTVVGAGGVLIVDVATNGAKAPDISHRRQSLRHLKSSALDACGRALVHACRQRVSLVMSDYIY